MDYLALLVAEIPLWICYMITNGELDFVTFQLAQPKTNAQLLAHFENNLERATIAWQGTTDEALQGTFSLKANGQLMYTLLKISDIGTTLYH